jgi:hypothetical protein
VTRPDTRGLCCMLMWHRASRWVSDVSGWVPYRATYRVLALAATSLFHFLSIFSCPFCDFVSFSYGFSQYLGFNVMMQIIQGCCYIQSLYFSYKLQEDSVQNSK